MALFKEIRNSFKTDKSKFPSYGITKGDLPLSFFDATHTRLSESPEIIAGVNVIADHVSRMTIRVMENTENGDKRVHNELSRFLDIEPNEYINRKNLIYGITKSLLLYGNQVTIPVFNKKGKLQALHPVSDSDVEFYQIKPRGYYLKIKNKRFENTDVLHLALNPSSESPYVGAGYQIPLKNVLDTLKKANQMKRVYLGGKYTPPVIISVDANNNSLRSKEGRQKIIEEYIENSDSNTPWLIPTSLMKVETVKPLTLKDVAINENVELDKKTVAAILGIPPFLLGVGEWKEDEYNNFIETKIASIAEIIEQEWTRKLVVNPKQHIKFNVRSLKSYSQESTAKWALEMHKHGIVSGNEVRDLQDFDPVDGLDERHVLENFIPVDRLGDQKKLKSLLDDDKGGE